jgi:adenosylcobinamide-GDP ribazoletransferase
MDKKIREYSARFWEELRAGGFHKKLGARFVSLWIMMARIPLPRRWLPDEALLPTADSMTVIPLVGAVLGFAAALPAWLISFLIPPAGAAWVACGLYVIFGWSLHLDGWGDLWDGVGSGRRKEAMMAVMKDSRTGSFAVIGIVLAISARAALLSSMDPSQWLSSSALAGGVGRFASVVAAYAGDYPWKGGMGREIVNRLDGYRLFCSLLFSLLLFPLAPFGWVIGSILSALAGLAISAWTNENLGGVNGDVLGASAVMGEILVLIACAI